MSEEEKQHEEEVFDQKLELDELSAAGGYTDPKDSIWGAYDADTHNCVQHHHRPLYGPDGNSFPNCAATVEDGSNCMRNDGCRESTVVYDGKVDCWRSWR